MNKENTTNDIRFYIVTAELRRSQQTEDGHYILTHNGEEKKINAEYVQTSVESIEDAVKLFDPNEIASLEIKMMRR